MPKNPTAAFGRVIGVLATRPALPNQMRSSG
jgi:hypothetical protein